jgi:hypothetical protein
MKINWTKAAMIAAGAVLLALLVINVKSCIDSKAQRDAMHQEMVEMKRLSDNIVRSQAKYVSKEDFKKFAKESGIKLDEIRDDLDEKDAQIKALSNVLVASLGRKQSGLGSSGTTPRPPGEPGDPRIPTIPCNGIDVECPDPFGYLTNSQHLALTEPFPKNQEVPIGSVTFDAWKEKPWSIDIRQRNYHITTVIGQDKRGRHYTYHKFEIGVDGKRYPVEIKDAQLVEEFPEASFSWWNPRVGIGMHGGIAFNTSGSDGVVGGVAVPSLSFSPFSYGQTETKPTWVFGRIGVGADVANKTVSFSLAPAMWNIGTEVEFIQNTYLGPVIGADIDGRINVGLGITTDF